MNKEELYQAWGALGPEMDARERLADYLSGKEVDCIPYGLISAKGALAKALGYTRKEVAESYELRCKLNWAAEEVLGSLTTEVSLGLRGIGEAAGSTLERPEDAMDFVSRYACQNYDDFFARKEFDARSNAILASKLEEGARLLGDFPDTPISTSIGGPFSTAASLRPFELLLRDLKRNPEQLQRLLAFCTDASLQWVEAFHEKTGCTKVSISDPVTTTDILSHEQFVEFSKPHLKRLFDGVTQITGRKPAVHICGRSAGIWKDLADMGVASLSVDNCENLETACKTIGDTVMISGNVPPVDVMMLGSIDEVIESARICIIKGASNPSGFMLMSGCQVPAGTPIENMIAFRYAARVYGANAKIGRVPEAALRA